MTGSDVQGDASGEELIRQGILDAPVSREDLEAFGWQQELASLSGPVSRWTSVAELRKRGDEIKEERDRKSVV